MVLSSGEASSLRRELARFGFPHTFTRTPYTVSAEDSEGSQHPTPGAPISGLPCRYRPAETLRTDRGGRETIFQPNLSIPADSPLAVGDLISVIADAAGTVLLDGPLLVESIQPGAAFGPTLYKRAYLRLGDVRL